VLFLVDTSQSLKDTDKNNQRVKALQSGYQALDSIATNLSTDGEPPKVYVEFLDFGTITTRSFPDRPEWAPVGAPGDIERIVEFGSRNQSEDTDYVAALEPWLDRDALDRPRNEIGALEMLELAPPDSCRSLLWFTDGEFDIDFQGRSKQLHWLDEPFTVNSDADGEEAEKLGETRLCDSEDLADRLRAGLITEGAGAFTTVVALGNADKFDLMNRVVAGTGSSQCGDLPPRGEVLSTEEVGELIFELTESANPSDSVLPDGSIDTCDAGDVVATDEPTDCELAFTLAPTIRGFNLLTLAGDPQVSTSLITPDGERVPLATTGQVPLENGASLTIEELGQDGDVYRVEGELAAGGKWSGQWRLRFESDDEQVVRNAVNRASMYLFFRSLEAKLTDGNVPIRLGTSRTLTVQLVNPDDEPESEDAYVDGSEIDVSVNGELVKLSDISPDGSFTFEIKLEEDDSAEPLEIEAWVRPVVQITDDTPPIFLPPWNGPLGTVAVEPLPQRPVLGDIEKFSQNFHQGQRVLRTSVFADANGENAGGCVKLVDTPSAKILDLDESGTIQVFFEGAELSTDNDCPILLAQGERKEIYIELSIEGVDLDQNEYRIEATLDFETTGIIEPVQSGPEPRPLQGFIKPVVKTETDWLRVALTTLLALVIPFLLMYIANWRAAKLTIDKMAHVVLNVAFVNGRLLRVDGAERRLDFTADDLQNVGNPHAGEDRNVHVGGFEFEAHVPKVPFRDVYATVEHSNSPLVVGDLGIGTRKGQGGSSVVMARAWAFASTSIAMKTEDDALERVDGRLVIVCPPVHQQALPHLSERVPEIETVLARNLLRVAEQSTPADVVEPELMDASEGLSSETGPFGITQETLSDTSLVADPLGGEAAASIDPPPSSWRSRFGSLRSRFGKRNDDASATDLSSSSDDGPALPF
jgi:hypothetical protein